MRKRIFLSFILLILLFGVSAAFLSSAVVASASRDQLALRLKEEAALLKARMQAGGGLAVLQAQASPTRLTYLSPDGAVLFDNQAGTELENHAGRPEVRQALETGFGSAVRYSQTLRATLVYSALRLDDGSVLRLSEPERVASRVASGVLPLTAFGVLLLALLSLPLADYLSGRLLKPILAIDPDRPEDAVVPEEILPLIRRIDAQNAHTREQMDALEARRQELDALLTGMHEGFVALGPKNEIILINPSARTMLGVTREQAMGRPLMEIDRSPAVLKLMKDLGDAGSAEGLLERSGRSLALSASALSGKRGWVLLLSDQTEKLQGEAMRKRFTANVSHELRTPLTTIGGSAELLQSGMVKPEDLQRFYGVIRAESSRMLALVEDILRLSRLDEGLPGGKREKVDLAEVAQAACQAMELPAKERGLRLSFTGEPAFVRGDRTLMYELCSNLIDNALKYNVENGWVEAVVNGAPQPTLTVRDGGIGIAPEHQPRVFERFYRTDASRSKATGGTGLGLSIVKHAAEYHRARITLDSALGAGTAVTVAFPPYREDAP